MPQTILAERFKMDQSTQVDFPIVVRKMKRHSTSGDLYLSMNNNNNNGSHSRQINPWSHIRHPSSGLNRPKSLNLTPDPVNGQNRTKIFYCSETSLPPPPRLPLPVSELHLSSSGCISRERTPPFSCNSSIASTATVTRTEFTAPSRHEEESSNVSCRCHDETSSLPCRRIPKDAAEGLSWRRLHMSRAKLKATATTSELLSGFAMIAMVELQINEPSNVPEWLFVVFAVCTTILVSVHIFALMISTYILPNVDAIAKLEVCEMVSESPHDRMKGFIELAWAFSTVLGLFLFLIEVAILCWVKFWDYSFAAAIGATVIVIPVLIIFVLFAVHFYHSLVVHKCTTSLSDMEKLENMKKQLDEVTISPV